MFKTNILLTGKHAEYLKRYSVDKQAEDQFEFVVNDNQGEKKKIHVFDTMIQTYMCAAMLGIIAGRSASEDRNTPTTANMFADVVMKNSNNLKRIVQFMILSTDDTETDQKIKNAFTIEKNESEVQERLNSFARGGLEIIDEYFSDCQTYSDVAYKLLEIIDDFGLKIDLG